MNRLAVPTSALALFLGAVHVAHAQFDTNLILNPGAEADLGAEDGDSIVPSQSWTIAGDNGISSILYGAGAPGEFPNDESPGPEDRGENFLAGGPTNFQDSAASQTTDVSSIAEEIDNDPRPTFTLSGYFGGLGAQEDNAVLTVSFKDGQDQTLGMASIGGFSASNRGFQTGLLADAAEGNVPAFTRTIEVLLEMEHHEGGYNDGYADNLSLVLLPEPSSIVVQASALAVITCFARRRSGLKQLG